MEKHKWPIIDAHSNSHLRPTVVTWLEALEAGKASIQKLASAYNVNEATVYHSISTMYFDLGEPEKAMRLAEEAMKKYPHRLFYEQYMRSLINSPAATYKDIQDYGMEWSKKYLDTSHAKKDEDFFSRDLSPDKRITLGFICTYTNTVVVEYSLVSVLKRIDRSKFRVVFFNVGNPGTMYLINAVRVGEGDKCVEVLFNDPDAIVRIAENEKIDILFDLNGFLRPDYPADVILKRIAPVQAIWWNTPVSSYIDTINYFMDDDYTVPEEYRKYFAETFCALDSGTTTCMELPETVPISEMPGAKKDEFVFASFTAMFKLNNGVIDVWARILRGAPKSKILIKCEMINASRHTLNRIAGKFVEYGITADRVLFERPTKFMDMMHRFAAVDLCLATFPYNPGTTTLNSLWQGVPTVTWAGEMCHNRGAANIMRDVGFGEFIASSKEEMVEKAVYYANNRKKLNDLRNSGLRDYLRNNSYHYNPDKFARSFERACRWMWQDWLSKAQVDKMGKVSLQH